MVFEKYIQNYIEEFNHLDRKFWNYEDGCVLIGLQAMYEASEDSFYYQAIQNYIDRYVQEDGAIRYYDKEEYNLDRIPSGRVLFLLYERTGQPKYRLALERLMEQLREQPRTGCGSFWHKKIYPFQIWLDGLYMGMPFYALYEKQFGNGTGYQDIVHQFENAKKYLYDEKTGLYYHGYDEKKELFWADPETGLSKNIWSRALGWYLMALIDCYEIMPQTESESRSVLKKLYQNLVDAVLRCQDKETGLFYQLTVLPYEKGNYLETSSSVMFAYAILKGYRLGLLDLFYRGKGEEILIALETRKFVCSYGELKLDGMCVGAGLGPENNRRRDGSAAYYLSERVVSDEQKGSGIAMMAYSEWLKIKKEKNGTYCSHPAVKIYNDGY
ncbi:MAG: glycoside hydrolase family 88 protein [Lachnospiraceae bacterium]|nr:glycoside hydrolase family 88 protein [Lachnospiraceae bacterium]